MRRLVRGELHEAAADPGREAGILERLRVVLGKRPCVERVLEVLESERKLQYVGVWAGVRPLGMEGC